MHAITQSLAYAECLLGLEISQHGDSLMTTVCVGGYQIHSLLHWIIVTGVVNEPYCISPKPLMSWPP